MRRIPRYAWIIPIFVFTILMVMGARTHSLWGDEAETALFGKSILTHGVPYGWDGTNIMGIDNAVVLNKNLINHTSPWAQYYIAALGLLLGNSSFAVRVPFMVISLLCLWALYKLAVTVTGDKKVGLMTLVLICGSIQFILFSYQARHYMPSTLGAILMTLGAVHMLHKKRYGLVFILGGVLYFYANYVSFFAWYVALCIALFVYWRMMGVAMGKSIRTFVAYSAGIVVLTAPWFFILNPLDTRGVIGLPVAENLFARFGNALYDAFFVYNFNNTFPFIFLILVVWALWRQRRVLVLPLILGSTYLLGMAVLSTIVQTDTLFTDVRYTMPVITMWSLVLGISFVELGKKYFYPTIIVILVFIFSTVFTFGDIISLPVLYLSEITHPYTAPDDAVAGYLRAHAKKGDTVWLSLDRDYEPLMFTLGDFVRFVNRVSLTNTRIFPKNRNLIPRYVYDFRGAPDWLVFYSDRGKDGTFMTFDYRTPPEGIDVADAYDQTILPVFFSDLTRPELEHRSFGEIPATGGDKIFIYHKKAGL